MKKLLWIIPIVIVCAVTYYLLTYRNKEPVQVVDSSPHYTTIFLQPLDNFTQQEAMQLQEVLEQRFRDIFNEDVWLCNVVHFLFGEHPEEIYFNVK